MKNQSNFKYKICIINVYLGKLPNYFSLWLKSAGFNPNIDFLLFTDDSISGAVPQNVKIEKIQLSEIKQRVENELGFEVVLPTPYKCCDYKSVYGLIFKDYLSDYDYWGHCDLDLIWGNLEECFEKNHLEEYDRFFYLGHLSLYRNTNKVNNYFKLSGSRDSYFDVFTTERICGFDETLGTVQIFLKNNIPFFREKLFADISPNHGRFMLSENKITNRNIVNYSNQLFYWENGRIFRTFEDNGMLDQEEFAYIHFQKRPNFNVDNSIIDSSRFAITNKGFFPLNNNPSLIDIKKYNPYRGALYEKYENIKAYFKMKKMHLNTKLKYGGNYKKRNGKSY